MAGYRGPSERLAVLRCRLYTYRYVLRPTRARLESVYICLGIESCPSWSDKRVDTWETNSTSQGHLLIIWSRSRSRSKDTMSSRWWSPTAPRTNPTLMSGISKR